MKNPSTYNYQLITSALTKPLIHAMQEDKTF